MDAVSQGPGLGSSFAASSLQRTDAMARLNAKYPNGICLFGVVEAAQKRLFEKLDVDGDGGVTDVELKALGGIGAGKNDPAAFAALDSDGDKKLSLRELRASNLFTPSTLGDLLAGQSSQGLLGWLVSEGDVDGNGALSLEEFRAVGPTGEVKPHVLPDGTPSQDPLDQILGRADRAFAAADADGDGQVTASELETIPDGYAHPVQIVNREAAAADLMARDRDASGGLSRGELASLDSAAVNLDALFETVDTDYDGQITAAEIAAQSAAMPEYKMSSEAVGSVIRLAENTPLGEIALRRLFAQSAARLVEQMVAAVRQQNSITV